MEIINYKKIKNNQHELKLDNGIILKLYDDTIIKYNLLINKNLDNKFITEITKFNEEIGSYYIALDYLNKKMRTELEIQKLLQKKEYDFKTINQTISKLKIQGYINDNKYIESYINDQYHLTNNGPEKIKYDLNKLGIDESKIIIDKDFSLKLKNIIEKKVKLNNKLNNEGLKINISNYLLNLGYSKEMFEEDLKNINVDDNTLIKKDYDKLYKKFYNKYDKDKLNFYLKDKLYKKGYKIDIINKIVD